MANVNNLQEAFYNSLIYFLKSSAALDTDFVNRMYISNPDLNLSNLTLPFILVTPYLNEGDVFEQPDVGGSAMGVNFTSRLMKFNFTIGVYCNTYAKQRELPQLVRRTILSATVSSEDGIQVYKGFDSSGDPDVGSELVVADVELGDITPLGGETEEDVVRKFRSMIDGYWEYPADKTVRFITTNT